MDEEEKLLTARFEDLAGRSYKNNIYTYLGFLSTTEQDIFLRDEKHFAYASPVLFGGSEICERKLLRFGSPEQFGYEEPWPLKAVCVTPLMQKFADDLTHRDFLGAVLNLGIERQTVGDILIKPGVAVLFCVDAVAETVVKELTRVKHTSVATRILELDELDGAGFGVEFETLRETVASLRADAVIAKMCGMSRTVAAEHFMAGYVTINGRLPLKYDMELKPGDVFTVRGHGKYIFDGVSGESRKGRLWAEVRRYK